MLVIDDYSRLTWVAFLIENSSDLSMRNATHVNPQRHQIVNPPMKKKENEFMLMAIQDLDLSCIENEINDEDAIVDMEGELMSALEQIDRPRIKKRKQKQLLIQHEKNRKDVTLIKLELEEEKKIEESLKQQLVESKVKCEHLEKEVVTIKK